MEDNDKKKKSSHLQQLEEAFEKRTRRFSAFEVLGLTPEGDQKATEDQPSRSGTSAPASGSDEPPSVPKDPMQGSERHPGGSKRHRGVSGTPPHRNTESVSVPGISDTPMHGFHTPIGGSSEPTSVSLTPSHANAHGSSILDMPHSVSDRHPHGSDGSIPGMDPLKDLVVVVNKTTTDEKPMSGTGGVNTPSGGTPRHTIGAHRYKSVSTGNTYGSNQSSASPDTDSHPGKVGSTLVGSITELRGLQFADVITGMQLGSQLGKKARQVLAHLNTMRSPNHESYTMPVGYGQISGATGVDAHYLRRKVLPKLAMLGLIGVARKGLEGTIYHLPYVTDYIRVVTGELPVDKLPATPDEPLEPRTFNDDATALPEWIDREQWGWLSPENVQRLVQKAGSEEVAREKLEMIIYNETHGPSERRVRNRRSVLAYYLSSLQAEIWPNDNGFETLEMKRAIWERERAQREKALAEEAMQARQEAEQAKFAALLSEAQLRWLKQEAKRRVDAKPASGFLQSRYTLYKAEEDNLTREWMDRAAYGERVPAAKEPA
jgi:hypothetical protein